MSERSDFFGFLFCCSHLALYKSNSTHMSCTQHTSSSSFNQNFLLSVKLLISLWTTIAHPLKTVYVLKIYRINIIHQRNKCAPCNIMYVLGLPFYYNPQFDTICTYMINFNSLKSIASYIGISQLWSPINLEAATRDYQIIVQFSTQVVSN